jgi:hypothetical protein
MAIDNPPHPGDFILDTDKNLLGFYSLIFVERFDVS